MQPYRELARENMSYFLSFKVSTGVIVQIVVVRVATLYSLVCGCHCFERMCCLHLLSFGLGRKRCKLVTGSLTAIED
jgi:hypothetical protein